MGAALGAVAGLPWVLYFVPRWISRLDADMIDHPANPAEGWPRTFEGRWLRAFGANMAVQFVGTIGILLLIIPGVIVFTLFGFAPTRILLRGDSFADSLRWSGRAMALNWPRIVQAALAILLVLFSGALALALVSNSAFERFGEAGPDAWTRLRHPLVWGIETIEKASLLWVTAAFLGLYHRLERLVAPPTDQPR